MDNELLLYLITCIDSLKIYMGIVVVGWIFSIIVIHFICFMFSLDKNIWENEAEFFKPVKTKLISFFPIIIILVLIDIFVPNKKDMIMIYAGSSILNISENPETKKRVGKSVDALEKYLDDYLKEETK